MATSEVQICNLALQRIGERLIETLTDTNSEPARQCNTIYTQTRDELLRVHTWNFSLKRVACGLLSEEPLYTYNYKYQLPSDCMKVISIKDDYKYKVLERTIETNASPLSILYIAKITDVTQFDSLFVTALVARLAYKLAYGLPNSNTLQQSVGIEYNQALAQAKSADAQEGTPEPLFNDYLTEARHSGSTVTNTITIAD